MLIDLKACKDKRDLAHLLGFQLKTITYQINIAPDAEKYKKICISKKNGNSRTVFSPNPILKSIQNSLLEIITSCYDQIHGGMNYPVSFGFIPNLNIYDNAKRHIGKRWVFNVDIKDYFDSINYGRVWRYLQKNKNFLLNAEIATMISQIVCFDGRLPQGAPTSPMMANLVSGSLDYRLRSLASEHKCTYSRYADDITFSTNLRDFPEEVARYDEPSGSWLPGKGLLSCVSRAWFSLNDGKTRMSYRRSKQVVTGLIVNKKVNVDREYFKLVRANIHHLLTGRPVILQEFCDPYGENCDGKEVKNKNGMSLIEGRINFCFEINDQGDERTDNAKFFKPSSVRKTYRDFLIYKYFIHGDRPILITEGESDIVYMAAYLKARSLPLANLVDVSPPDNRKILIDFYQFPKRPSKIIGMTGGTSGVAFALKWVGEILPRLGKNVSRRKF
ncbi:retron-type reverse transcriptase [Sphingopyxis sp. OAS728]|uniref:reverse transcriptase domain-containing protein n=1 Tax=Sphingopyxis sp. OAS728 TaxID=2663823 RepID=UPI00178B2458|nr:reverse transcriptase domain-containing protein [Sphingopyxis sp. OAS728]MBE1525655.1 retron-type reverse transcriptase [Sphingopyxis sp. OAS728]